MSHFLHRITSLTHPEQHHFDQKHLGRSDEHVSESNDGMHLRHRIGTALISSSDMLLRASASVLLTGALQKGVKVCGEHIHPDQIHCMARHACKKVWKCAKKWKLRARSHCSERASALRCSLEGTCRKVKSKICEKWKSSSDCSESSVSAEDGECAYESESGSESSGDSDSESECESDGAEDESKCSFNSSGRRYYQGLEFRLVKDENRPHNATAGFVLLLHEYLFETMHMLPLAKTLATKLGVPVLVPSLNWCLAAGLQNRAAAAALFIRELSVAESLGRCAAIVSHGELGGQVALALAGAPRDSFFDAQTKMVFICPPNRGASVDFVPAQVWLESSEQNLQFNFREKFLNEFYFYPDDNAVLQRLLKKLSKNVAKTSAEPLNAQFLRTFLNEIVSDCAPSFAQSVSSLPLDRVLCITGSLDPFSQASEFSCIPGMKDKVVEIEGSGHCPHLVFSHPVNRVLSKFLRPS